MTQRQTAFILGVIGGFILGLVITLTVRGIL